jgi:hypothetical protein
VEPDLEPEAEPEENLEAVVPSTPERPASDGAPGTRVLRDRR